MTEKLKYKVGDKVLIEAEVTERYKGIGDLRDQIEGFDIKMSSKIIMPKPKVPQAVMDWYFKFQENNWDVESYLVDEPKPNEVDKWLYTGNRQLNSERQHALGTLIAYGPEVVEVEKEKRYEVRFKNDVVFSRNLVYDSQVRTFEFSAVRDRDAYQFTKQELIDAGFEGVFDNPMFEVEEVE